MLRGPQSTLYGRNVVGVVVNIFPCPCGSSARNWRRRSPSGRVHFQAGYQHAIVIGGGTITPRADFRTLSREIVYAAPRGRFSLTAYPKNVNDKLIEQSHFLGYAGSPRRAPMAWVGTSRF